MKKGWNIELSTSQFDYLCNILMEANDDSKILGKGWDIQTFDNLRREPNHPRNKFDYTVIVPDHPLGYHEHYTMDLEVAKKSAIEWAADYGRASVENRNLETVFAVR